MIGKDVSLIVGFWRGLPRPPSHWRKGEESALEIQFCVLCRGKFLAYFVKVDMFSQQRLTTFSGMISHKCIYKIMFSHTGTLRNKFNSKIYALCKGTMDEFVKFYLGHNLSTCEIC